MIRLDTLFFNVGGVCLTNGWDTDARLAAASHFVLDVEETEDRHQALAEGFECGELSLDAYLDHVVFHRERTFSRDAFIAFMRSRSQPHSASLSVIARLASDGRYRLATINNESREMNRYRIDTFGLGQIFSAFFSSCYLGVRKPTRGSTRSPSMSCRRSPRPACSWTIERRTWRERGPWAFARFRARSRPPRRMPPRRRYRDPDGTGRRDRGRERS